MKWKMIVPMVLACFCACSDSRYPPAETVADLAVSFVDPKWDGKNVPQIGQCRNCGGGGWSPALRVKNITKEADVLIAEFNDKSIPGLSKDGGHGAIRVHISQTVEFVIPSVEEQTFDLPPGVEVESQHRAPMGKLGVYMAPCGCGNENRYETRILAVENEPDGQKRLAGKGIIDLGKF